MTYKDVSIMLSALDIPFAYYQFPDGTDLAPPFMAFYYASSNDLYSDNTNYQRIDNLVIELYTDTKDFELEKSLETTLNENGLAFYKIEQYLDDEKMFETIYTMDIVITEETINE